jgi:hypothetical protein
MRCEAIVFADLTHPNYIPFTNPIRQDTRCPSHFCVSPGEVTNRKRATALFAARLAVVVSLPIASPGRRTTSGDQIVR